MHDHDQYKQPTKNELQEEAERLRRLVQAGTATMAQAERFAEVEHMLRRYEAIATGQSW